MRSEREEEERTKISLYTGDIRDHFSSLGDSYLKFGVAQH